MGLNREKDMPHSGVTPNSTFPETPPLYPSNFPLSPQLQQAQTHLLIEAMLSELTHDSSWLNLADIFHSSSFLSSLTQQKEMAFLKSILPVASVRDTAFSASPLPQVAPSVSFAHSFSST